MRKKQQRRRGFCVVFARALVIFNTVILVTRVIIVIIYICFTEFKTARNTVLCCVHLNTFSIKKKNRLKNYRLIRGIGVGFSNCLQFPITF